ncbi:transposase [uncultured Corynebacterium sp.]|uniref:transposase n=1 Tax=uncultured Corynebacterium sp. TaxID=159447 RepID=UPI0025ED6C5A|nr:transposase [uncultured Corynebacterium sp.]
MPRRALFSALKERDPSFREQIQVVTMDGFTSYATAVEEQLPQANKVVRTTDLVTPW